MDRTFETCPDLDAVERSAHAWAIAIHGRLPTEMSVSAARRYLARGWGLPTSRERAEVAVGAGSWVFARSRAISVAYTMAAGESRGGFDRGDRPVAYSTYTVVSIDAWARFYLSS